MKKTANMNKTIGMVNGNFFAAVGVPGNGWAATGLCLMLAAAATAADQALPPIPTEEPVRRGFVANVEAEPEVKMDFPIAAGAFKPTWESINAGHPGEPTWWRDGKLGVFIHWGPQAAGRAGDWFARNLYDETWKGRKAYVERFGHPSTFGYKDVLPTWTAPEWNPGEISQLFADAGFRYALVQGVHHDNFDLWNSRYQPWNSVRIGPKKDLLAGWNRELRARGMRVGVAFHHEYSWWWYQRAFESDTQGPYAGKPYDGNLTLADGKGTWWEGLDPRLLYGLPMTYPNLKDTDGKPFHLANITYTEKQRGIFGDHGAYAHWYATQWALRIMDVMDNYDPDFIYTDGTSTHPFSGSQSGAGYKCDAAARVLAHYYNKAASVGRLAEKTALIKFCPPNRGAATTFEGWLPNNILSERMWMEDNCIGDWYWAPGFCYDPILMVRQLLEVVARDGNLTLCISITPEGSLDAGSRQMLASFGRWMQVNGEGIYGSKAWKVWGEGELVADPRNPGAAGAIRVLPAGKLKKSQAEVPFTSQDIRFTQGKDKALYAWLLAWPEDGKVVIRSLAPAKGLGTGTIASVRLLGSDRPVQWTMSEAGLMLQLPEKTPTGLAYGIRIDWKNRETTK
jgi:alpha-L-fucosidase